MKIVERVLERQIQTLVNLNKKHFGYKPGKATLNAILIERKMEEKYQEKSYRCVLLKWKRYLTERLLRSLEK